MVSNLSLMLALSLVGTAHGQSSTSGGYDEATDTHGDTGFCYAHGNSQCALSQEACSGTTKWYDHSKTKICSCPEADAGQLNTDGTITVGKCDKIKYGGCYSTTTHTVRPEIAPGWCEAGEMYVKHDSAQGKAYTATDIEIGWCKISDGKNSAGADIPYGGFCALSAEACFKSSCIDHGITGYGAKPTTKEQCTTKTGMCSGKLAGVAMSGTIAAGSLDTVTLAAAADAAVVVGMSIYSAGGEIVTDKALFDTNPVATTIKAIDTARTTLTLSQAASKAITTAATITAGGMWYDVKTAATCTGAGKCSSMTGVSDCTLAWTAYPGGKSTWTVDKQTFVSAKVNSKDSSTPTCTLMDLTGTPQAMKDKHAKEKSAAAASASLVGNRGIPSVKAAASLLLATVVAAVALSN
jgi:hypothetical protein